MPLAMDGIDLNPVDTECGAFYCCWGAADPPVVEQDGGQHVVKHLEFRFPRLPYY
jgi:hypothetical protein